MSKKKRTSRMGKRRCLIIEHHAWETGAHSHQLQIPLSVARKFFGPGLSSRKIRLRVFIPPGANKAAYTREVSISKDYEKSRTRRLNEFHELGAIPSAFMFFQESGASDEYDFWWELDKAIVAARFHSWTQAKSSQHGRGRLVTVVNAPVPRGFTRID